MGIRKAAEGWIACSGARDVARSGAQEGSSAGGWELVFHKGQSQVSKPTAAAICAGDILCQSAPLALVGHCMLQNRRAALLSLLQ